MAASDKNIIITPNRGGATAEPEIFFGGSGNNPIRLKVLDDSTGTLSFEGSAGQLFSINNSLTSGSIFSVNDVSGIPSIDVNANGIVSLAPFGGTVGIGTTTPTSKLSVAGTISATNIVNGIVVGGSTLTGSVSLTAGSNVTLTPSGSTITIASSGGGGGGGITTTAVNTFTATQIFTAGISASGATFSGGDIHANRVVGGNGSAIGSGGLVVNGTVGDNDSQLILKKPSQSAFSVLSWNGESYIATNVNYLDGVWTHSAPSGNVNSNLINIIPGTGVRWFSSNNSSASFPVSNGNLLWNNAGNWVGGLSSANVVNRIMVGGATLTGNVSITSGSNITLTPSGSTLTIASSGGGGGGGGVTGIVVGGATLTGSVSLTAGSNITLTPSGSTITIASTASGGVGPTGPAGTVEVVDGILGIRVFM